MMGLPRGYSLLPIMDYNMLSTGDVNYIRTVGYAVSVCELHRESTIYCEDGTTKKEYIVRFPYKNAFIDRRTQIEHNDLDSSVLTRYTESNYFFENIEDAKKACEEENKILLENELKNRNDKEEFLETFYLRKEYIENNKKLFFGRK